MPQTLGIAPATPVSIVEASQGAPEGAPPEFQAPALLKEVEPDAGWVDGFAYGGAIVRYFASNAVAKATVISQVGSKSEEAEESFTGPRDGELAPDVPTVTMQECKGTIEGTAYGRIWDQALIKGKMEKWGEQARTATRKFECPRPQTTTTTTTSSSPGEDDAGSTCYTLEIDHYWYYPSTGDVEYRYTETHFWCEKGGDAYM